MTDQELKDLVASLAVSQDRTDAQLAKTDAQLAATSAQMAKTDEKLDRLAKLYGGVADNQGSSAEEFFFNSLCAKPMLGGMSFDRVSANQEVAKGKQQAEFDIVMVNGKSVAVIEVKYKVHPRDVEKAAENLTRFREFFPEFNNFTLYGGIAGMSIPPESVEAAKALGLAVLKRVGDVLESEASDMRAH